MKKMIFFLVLLMALHPVLCSGQDFPTDLESDQTKTQTNKAILMDLSQTLLSWETGGFGLSLGVESRLSPRFSLFIEGIFMNLKDAPASPKMILAALGPRYYFSTPTIQGFYTGIYPLVGIGIVNGIPGFLSGFQAELGFAWRIGSQKQFILEPYIKYHYFFGQPPLIGIAPGLTIGYVF